MKAIQITQFGGPDVLEWKDLEEPEPGQKEVLVRLAAVGVNPVETYIRQGGYGKSDPELPYTPGTDGAGIVEKTGPGAERLKEGDRVFICASVANRNTGTYAEKVVCDEDAVYPLPDTLSFKEGASLGVTALAAHRALYHRGKVRPAEHVLIHGASGGVGSLAVQMANYYGATVIGTAGSEEGRELVKKSGAAYVLDHHKDGHLDELPDLIGQKGVELVLEMLANVNLEKDLKHVSRNGRVVVVGSRDSLDFHPRLTMNTESDILGMSIASYTPHEFRETMAALTAMLESGKVKPFIGRTFPLKEAADAHREVSDGNANGNVVLKIAE